MALQTEDAISAPDGPVKSVENNSTPTSMQHIQKYLVGYSIELNKKLHGRMETVCG